MGDAERLPHQEGKGNMLTTTIAAISTPAGKGGIGIVRISGPDAFEITEKVFFPMKKQKIGDMPGYTACLGTVRDIKGNRIDQAILLCFRAPKSYTGAVRYTGGTHNGKNSCKNR